MFIFRKPRQVTFSSTVSGPTSIVVSLEQLLRDTLRSQRAKLYSSTRFSSSEIDDVYRFAKFPVMEVLRSRYKEIGVIIFWGSLFADSNPETATRLFELNLNCDDDSSGLERKVIYVEISKFDAPTDGLKEAVDKWTVLSGMTFAQLDGNMDIDNMLTSVDPGGWCPSQQ